MISTSSKGSQKQSNVATEINQIMACLWKIFFLPFLRSGSLDHLDELFFGGGGCHYVTTKTKWNHILISYYVFCYRNWALIFFFSPLLKSSSIPESNESGCSTRISYSFFTIWRRKPQTELKLSDPCYTVSFYSIFNKLLLSSFSITLHPSLSDYLNICILHYFPQTY